MFCLALTNFIRSCRINVLFLIISFLCLECAFVSFLFIQERGYYMYKESIVDEQVTKVLYFACDDIESIKNLYAKFANDPMLPQMEIVTVSNEKYAGIEWNRKQNENVLYTPYGRFFSTAEMESGANVTLLGTSFISQLPQKSIDTIWETGIDINGKHFSAIGNYFFNWVNGSIPEEVYKSQPVSASIVIPLKAYFDVGISATRFRCVFSQSLTSTQITHLNDLIQPFQSIYSLSLPLVYNVDAVNSYINVIAPYTLIIIISLLSIVSVIIYWLRREFERYRIYLICGAKRRQITFLLSMNILLLVTITYFCAYLIITGLMKITPDGIVSSLPWQFYIIIYICMLFFTLLTVNIRAIPIVFREKNF